MAKTQWLSEKGDHFVIEISDDRVVQCKVDSSLQLVFEKTGINIQLEQPFSLRTPGWERTFAPNEWAELGSALAIFLTKKVIAAKAWKSGDLELNFEDSTRLRAEPHPQWESWHVQNEDHSLPAIHCMAGGELSVYIKTVIEVNGLRIAYQRFGSGPTLVLLHGILGDSRDWRPQIESLSDSFEVIAWDAPGCGQSSDPPEGEFGAADFANCLAGFMRSVTRPPAHVAGLSWGGVLALELYKRHPDMVASLILADTYAGWKGSLPDEVVAERLASCLRESDLAPERFVPGWIPDLVTEHAPQGLRDEITATMSSFHPVGYRAMALAFANLDLRRMLPTILVPALLIWGEDDRRSPLSVAYTMRDSVPGARLAIIPNAGHMSNIEQPQRFNAEVSAFLQEVETGAEHERP